MQQRLLRSDSINVTDKANACWRLLTRNLNLLLSPNFSTLVVRNRYGIGVALNVALVRRVHMKISPLIYDFRDQLPSYHLPQEYAFHWLAAAHAQAEVRSSGRMDLRS